MSMMPLPFTISGVWNDFGECAGLLHDRGDRLELEFETRDVFLGVCKSGVKRVSIPLAELASIRLDKGWLGRDWLGVTVKLQLRSLEPAAPVPGMAQGLVTLAIARKDSEQAGRFVDDLYEDVPETDQPPALRATAAGLTG